MYLFVSRSMMMKKTLLVTALFCASLSALAAQTPEFFLQMGHSGIVYAVAYSPDGRRIATASFDDTIKIWDTESGRELRTLAGHTNTVYAVAYSPDGRRIATGSWDNTVKIWNAETGQEIRTLTGHTSRITSVTYSPEGRRISSGSWDKTIKIGDVENGIEIRNIAHDGMVNSVSFSPDGRRLVSSTRRPYSLNIRWIAAACGDGAVR
jgi:WD40 repeat protein